MAPNENTCRICLEDDSSEPLISPCAGCRGSSAFVHFSCIDTYYKVTQHWWEIICPTCKCEYEGEAALTLGAFGLKAMEESGKRDCPNYGVLLTNLSSVYGTLGDALQQRSLLERALAVKIAALGKDHTSVANTLINLGNACGCLGDTRRKVELLERALVIKESTLGKDHPDVSIILTNLGNALGDQGNVQSKKKLLERALDIKLKVCGPEHYSVALTLANLGNAHGSLGEVQTQKEYLQRALAIETRNHGNCHINVAISLISLGQAHAALKEFNDSKITFDNALRIAHQTLGFKPNALCAEMQLFAATAWRASGDLEEAQLRWSSALQHFAVALGEDMTRARLSIFIKQGVVYWQAAGMTHVAEWLSEMNSELKTWEPMQIG